jgi:hypothetical protein
VIDSQLGTYERRLEHGCISRVSNDGVGDAMRNEIERTTHGYTARLMTPPTFILHCGEQARAKDRHRARGVPM